MDHEQDDQKSLTPRSALRTDAEESLEPLGAMLSPGGTEDDSQAAGQATAVRQKQSQEMAPLTPGSSNKGIAKGGLPAAEKGPEMSPMSKSTGKGQTVSKSDSKLGKGKPPKGKLFKGKGSDGSEQTAPSENPKLNDVEKMKKRDKRVEDWDLQIRQKLKNEGKQVPDEIPKVDDEFSFDEEGRKILFQLKSHIDAEPILEDRVALDHHLARISMKWTTASEKKIDLLKDNNNYDPDMKHRARIVKKSTPGNKPYWYEFGDDRAIGAAQPIGDVPRVREEPQTEEDQPATDIMDKTAINIFLNVEARKHKTCNIGATIMMLGMFSKELNPTEHVVYNIFKLKKMDQFDDWKEAIYYNMEKAGLDKFLGDLVQYGAKFKRIGSKNVESSIELELDQKWLKADDVRKTEQGGINVHILDNRHIHAFMAITKAVKNSISSRLKNKIEMFSHFAIPLDSIILQLAQHYTQTDHRDSTSSETEEIRNTAIDIAQGMNRKNRTEKDLDKIIKEKTAIKCATGAYWSAIESIEAGTLKDVLDTKVVADRKRQDGTSHPKPVPKDPEDKLSLIHI